MKRLILKVSILALLAGCANSSHIITGQTRPPLSPSQVRLYDRPPAKYEEIGIIEASSRGAFAIGDQAKIDTVIARLKEQAAELGANGVLLESTGTESSGGVVMGTATGTNPSFGTGIYSAAFHKTGKALAIYVP